MKTLSQYFEDYATYHQTPGNQISHIFGIPFIVVTLLGLLSGWVWMEGFDAGMALMLVATIWYLILDFRMGLAFIPFILGMYALGRVLPTPVLWVFFVLGWILQGIGHYKYEKKAPAFFKNIEHLLIGPLWVFAKLSGLRPRA